MEKVLSIKFPTNSEWKNNWKTLWKIIPIDRGDSTHENWTLIWRSTVGEICFVKNSRNTNWGLRTAVAQQNYRVRNSKQNMETDTDELNYIHPNKTS
jgi:hypothetical protein